MRGAARRGITLMEVLISMGVLSVGVLGAASLLPMATYFQNETTKYDRGGALAQQAVHDLQIRNYLSPRRWIFLDPANPNVASPVGIVGLAGSGSYTPLSAFVLDPLGFSYVASQTPAVAGFPCYFPAFPNQGATPPGGGPAIYRAGVTANEYWPAAATEPVATPIIMSFAVADRFMRSNDDVLFETDRASLLAQNRNNIDLRPTSITSTGINAPSAYAPNFAGDFSWLATVSRVPSDMVNGPAIAASLHRFQVSVVVLQKRDLTLWTGALTDEKPPSERQVYAMFTQYAGQSGNNLQVASPFYGGGGLQLYVYESSATPALGQPTRHWLDGIKPNTYLMLAGNFQDQITAKVYPQLAWYRILNVDDGPLQDSANSSRWYRNVTVSGGDWPGMWAVGAASQLWYGADPGAPNAMMPYATSAAANPLQAPTVFCTLMDDAIAEFDQTITLDYSLVRE
ncbi:MAG TPA: hypothetical protein VFW87_11445 [Pirellulales bacterium]|nr:hypothetical protein [Pirellulales bacterium]